MRKLTLFTLVANLKVDLMFISRKKFKKIVLKPTREVVLSGTRGTLSSGRASGGIIPASGQGSTRSTAHLHLLPELGSLPALVLLDRGCCSNLVSLSEIE